MSPEWETRLYTDVLREVIWGAERDEIFHLLQTNGMTGEAAEQMFRRARNERLAILRGEGLRRVAKGILALAAGIALFCFFWFWLGLINRPLIVISGLLSAGGFWCLLGGMMDILLAPTKRGSVAAGDE